MLPKKFRLHDYPEVEKVKKEGKLYQSSLFGLLVLSTSAKLGVNSAEGPSSRFSFIISTKLSKKATERNHIKRVLSEAVRLMLPKVKPGFDGVFLGKKSLIGKTLKQIEVEVMNVFTKADLIVG